jgi:integral membrane protein
MWTTPIGRLRVIGLLEGASFLALLGVAMPLKYLAGMPTAVQYVGWVHGLLFVSYVLAILSVMSNTEWSLPRGATAFAAGLVPFGPFLHDRHLRAELRATIDKEATRDDPKASATGA